MVFSYFGHPIPIWRDIHFISTVFSNLVFTFVCPQSVIMEENVNKSRDRRAARHRKAIKETQCYEDDPWGSPPKTTLEREIRFARAIILPYPQNAWSSRNINTRRKVVPHAVVYWVRKTHA